jgi:hypothetical protein
MNSKNSQEVFSYRNLAEVETGKFQLNTGESTISGTILDEGKPVASKKIYLLNEKGQVIDEANTDAKGDFQFKELPSSGDYSFLMDESDKELDIQISISEPNHANAREFDSREKKEAFAFRPLDDVKSSVVTVAADDATMSGIVIAEDGKPLSNRKVYLIDDKGKVQRVATTENNGAFEFKDLKAGRQVAVMMEGSSKQNTIRVLMRDKDGKVLDGFSSDNRASVFRYKRGHKKAAVGTGIGVRICGTLLDHGVGVSDHKVILIDRKGRQLGCATTDSRGGFDFGVVSFNKVDCLLLLDECDEFLNLEFEAQNKNGGTLYKFNNKANKELIRYQLLSTYEPQIKN